MCHRESGFVCYSSMTEPVLTNTLAWLAPQSFLLPAPPPDLPWSADCHLFCLSKDCHVSALRTSCVLTLVHAPILRTTLAHSSFLLWDCLPSSWSLLLFLLAEAMSLRSQATGSDGSFPPPLPHHSQFLLKATLCEWLSPSLRVLWRWWESGLENGY